MEKLEARPDPGARGVAAAEEVSMVKKTILIADDEEDILALVEKILTQENYRVLTARNGRELFKLLDESTPDLILLDVMMPTMDGYEVCHQLKTSPATKHIPVVMLTVLATPNNIRKGMEMGAAAYLTKPFDPSILGREIKSLLKKYGE